ncbi:NADP-dependent oxidoreductase [Chryseobacterium sp. S-02]|jgi:NADPH:quinone reductase-like Zn-dependent oxidoreductase|uniref:NADP-dependent oxidoreductase n=1 Tax=unclassified Chryseobacterium TaxID=2593645 RepID=UPI002864CB77|nr:NADP-dependent oxidoreductase [Chryseobacterium sp. 2987]MDF2931138.1 NADP-dependent oxidoreductase [Chryseobacterium sp.]MDR6919911.1 NADPH:quinone reductase-like Zn-dependent oxidoreductase [Chryseobacterium sp. 2987]
MKAVILKKQGDVDQLSMVELPIPTPNDDEVLIRVHAISINPTDIYARQNPALDYIFNNETPKILGWDISGVIETIGNNVSTFTVGDEVFGLLNFPTFTTAGHAKAYAEYVVANIADITIKPDNISHDEAAAAGMAALTTWQPLIKNSIKMGDRVLITAAGGGVGHFAVQFAKYFGAYVIAVASGSKKDLVMSLGADEFVDYQKTDLLEVTEPVDYVIEGLRDEHIQKTLSIVKKGGTLLSLWSHIEGSEWKKRAKELDVHAYYNAVVSNGKDMTAIAGLMKEGLVKSHVSKKFKLEEIAQAHTELEKNHTAGKIIVNP